MKDQKFDIICHRYAVLLILNDIQTILFQRSMNMHVSDFKVIKYVRFLF